MNTIKLCECGCGKPTLPAKDTNKKLGLIKGQPTRCLRGHNRKKYTIPVIFEPKLCECGCGRETNIAKYSLKKRNQVKGKPVKYIKGHSGRKQIPQNVSPRLCACGCGKHTPISKMTSKKRGSIMGMPTKFCRGHRSIHRRKYYSNLDKLYDGIDIKKENECWEWKKHKNEDGYGTTSTIGRKFILAHRLAFLVFGGVLTKDKPLVLHHCDNPACCNPKHLFAGNDKDNVQDMLKKGRESHKSVNCGSKNGSAIFSNDDVYKIRYMYNIECKSIKDIALLLGVGKENIWRVVTRRSYFNI